jgi:hypothetical protein
MVVLYYGAVIEAVRAGGLPGDVEQRIVAELRRILSEEETHLEIEAQHNALLAADRSQLGARAVELLEALESLGADDYHWTAELAMREIAQMIGRYAAGPDFRREIEARRASGA